jgi:uncharacterized protein (DUF58 family)
MEVIKGDPEADWIWKDGFGVGVLAGVSFLSLAVTLVIGLAFASYLFLVPLLSWFVFVLGFLYLYDNPAPIDSSHRGR